MNLIDYFLSHRQIGHTTLLKKGADNYDKPFFIVCSDLKHVQTIKRELKNKNAKLITLSTFEDKTRGTENPIAFDNFTLNTIFQEVKISFDEFEILHTKTVSELELENYNNLKYFFKYYRTVKKFKWYHYIFQYKKTQNAIDAPLGDYKFNKTANRINENFED